MRTPTTATSAEGRAKLVDALLIDRPGPWPGDEIAHELPPENPARWYLSGCLMPRTRPCSIAPTPQAKNEVDPAGGGRLDFGIPWLFLVLSPRTMSER
jgi:hypothetical protein